MRNKNNRTVRPISLGTEQPGIKLVKSLFFVGATTQLPPANIKQVSVTQASPAQSTADQLYHRYEIENPLKSVDEQHETNVIKQI